MPQLPNSPDDQRNRKGCFTILGLLAAFVALYLLVSFHAQPGNDGQQHIQTVPAPTH